MKDGIIKGTGNSRYLKSAIPAGTTWEQALAMLTGGTFPIDFNGINENGWQQLATVLNKANLLSDTTKDSIGLTQTDPTVNDALYKLRALITDVATSRARIEVGSYVGTGTYGKNNPNSITCSFAPKLVVVMSENVGGYSSFLMVWAYNTQNNYYSVHMGANNPITASFTLNNNTLSWVCGVNSTQQGNIEGFEYCFAVLG